MADQLPINFAIPSESAVISYPYSDIQDGIGHVTYYLCVGESSGGYSYDITTKSMYSVLRHLGSSSTVTWTFYTAAFNAPKVLQGTFYANFSVAGTTTGAGGNVTASVKLYHYDGATSTQLGSTWTGTAFAHGGAGTISREIATISVTTPKKFAIGDQVKVEMILTLTGGADMELGSDPQNNDSSNLTAANGAFTASTLYIPYKIQE